MLYQKYSSGTKKIFGGEKKNKKVEVFTSLFSYLTLQIFCVEEIVEWRK
jgi:hypothetical protein